MYLTTLGGLVCLPFLLVPAGTFLPLPRPQPRPQPSNSQNGSHVSSSVIVLDDNANISKEQESQMAIDFTRHFFSPNDPEPTNVPLAFAFDVRSPLKRFYPPDMRQDIVNDPGFTNQEVDFGDYPKEDILTPFYELDFPHNKVPKALGDKPSDKHLVNKVNLMNMLEQPLTMPRSSERDTKMAESVGQYITRKMGVIGLLTGTQVFKQTQFHGLFWDTEEEVPAGVNIIGIYPGKHFGTHRDKLVLVGAHWDTTGTTDGFDDNGSGVAATLEVARALVESDCQLMYSVMFVAFDKEETGCQGSHEFLRGFFLPKFFNTSSWPEFQGAIIMDSLLNYNTTKGSQMFPDAWKTMLPDTWAQIVDEEQRGDFLSVLYREKAESELADLFTRHYNNILTDRQSPQTQPSRFKLKRLAVNLPSEPTDNLELLADNAHFLRSDHARFWYAYEKSYTLSLRALLLTDTGPFRGEMKKCYHKYCDSNRNGFKADFANYDFLAVTVQAVIDTVTDLSGAHCKSKRSRSLSRYSQHVLDTRWHAGEEESNEIETEKVHPLGAAKDEDDDDEPEEQDHDGGDDHYISLTGSADRPSTGASHLANTALYLAYYFNWAPSLLLWG